MFSLSVLVLLVGVLAFVSSYPSYSANSKYEQYAVVFPPDTGYEQAMGEVMSSGGLPVRVGSFDFIVIAASDDRDFTDHVKEKGAVFVFSPLIKGGCITKNKAAFRQES